MDQDLTVSQLGISQLINQSVSQSTNCISLYDIYGLICKNQC